MRYIMTPELFNSLLGTFFVTDLNGKNYREHIVIIFRNELDKETQDKILSFEDDKEALELLKTKISITHTLNFK